SSEKMAEFHFSTPYIVVGRKRANFFAGSAPIDPAFDPRGLPFVQNFFSISFSINFDLALTMAGHTGSSLCFYYRAFDLAQAACASAGLATHPRANKRRPMTCRL